MKILRSTPQIYERRTSAPVVFYYFFCGNWALSEGYAKLDQLYALFLRSRRRAIMNLSQVTWLSDGLDRKSVTQQTGQFTWSLCARRSYLKVNRPYLFHLFISEFVWLCFFIIEKMTKPQLKYFDCFGRGGSIKLLFKVDLILISKIKKKCLACKFRLWGRYRSLWKLGWRENFPRPSSWTTPCFGNRWFHTLPNKSNWAVCRD